MDLQRKARKINTNKKQFDLRVHIRDGKGNIVNEQPYRLTIKNGVKEFERPPGSGFIYDEGGVLLRGPKGGPAGQEQVAKPEYDQDALLAELAQLRAKVAAKEILGDVAVGSVEVGEAELEEIHMTADDVAVDDLPTSADASDLVAAAKAESKPLFQKPSFLKGNK